MLTHCILRAACYTSINPRATINSALSTDAPAAPRTVLCPNATNFMSSTSQVRTRPTLTAMWNLSHFQLGLMYGVLGISCAQIGKLHPCHREAAMFSALILFAHAVLYMLRDLFREFSEDGVPTGAFEPSSISDHVWETQWEDASPFAEIVPPESPTVHTEEPTEPSTSETDQTAMRDAIIVLLCECNRRLRVRNILNRWSGLIAKLQDRRKAKVQCHAFVKIGVQYGIRASMHSLRSLCLKKIAADKIAQWWLNCKLGLWLEDTCMSNRANTPSSLPDLIYDSGDESAGQDTVILLPSVPGPLGNTADTPDFRRSRTWSL